MVLPSRPNPRLEIAPEAPLVLPAILDPFARNASPAVMARLVLDWMITGTPFDAIFDELAQEGYTRNFTLDHIVPVMLDVACGYRCSPRAAFFERDLQKIASYSAFCRKLNRLEPALPQEIVRRTAARSLRIVEASGGLKEEPIPGYAARVLDGNVLSGTEHRIKPLRTTNSAGLPGKSLTVYEPASEVVTQVVLEEDAHTQERALLDRIVIAPGELWIADRNFSVRWFLFRIADAGSFFVVRRHASALPFEEAGPLRDCGRCSTGRIQEQPIQIRDDAGRVLRLRRIVLTLDEPTREGDTEIVLVTNLPEEVTAQQCCEAYLTRWTIEGHYQALTDLLHCEVPSLGYPRAALLAFAMSVMAGNALAVLKANLRVAHGEEIAAEVSVSELVRQAREDYPGMMKGVPGELWPDLSCCTASAVAGVLNELAGNVPVHRMFRSHRGPKKPQPKRSSGKRIHHVSNKKLLDQERAKRTAMSQRASPRKSKH